MSALGWQPERLVRGVLTWQHVSRADAITLQEGAYKAWRAVSLPDGGQSWVLEGRWSTAYLAMSHLDELATGTLPLAGLS